MPSWTNDCGVLLYVEESKREREEKKKRKEQIERIDQQAI